MPVMRQGEGMDRRRSPTGEPRLSAKARLVRLLPVVAALALVGLFAFPGGASADPLPGTIVVGSRVDQDQGMCSLRDAIATANTHTAQGGCTAGLTSGTDTIEVPAETYDLGSSGQLVISSDMNIVGAGAHSVVIHASTGRVFEITNTANAAISGVTIESGDAPTGGGILVDSGTSLELQDAIVSANLAATSGGGIENDGSLTITGSTIENNSTIGAGGTGGGIEHLGASLSITNSTIMSNTSQGDGGGLLLGGTTNLKNDTIANNSTGGQGGGLAVSPAGTVDVLNTLIAGNLFGTTPSDCSGMVTSLGGNLDDDGTCGLGAGDQSDVDPQLGPVDTSGPTDVLSLQSNSPAIDAGNDLACPATDQRDDARPQGSDCDIGAYEFTPNAPTEYDVSTVDELASSLSAANSNQVATTIQLASGQYDVGNLIGTAEAPEGTTLDGAGAGAATTILDGDGSATDVVDIQGSTLTTIKGVTVEDAVNTGINDNGNLELDDSVVQNNADLGIDTTNHGLDVSGSTISGNGIPSGPAQFNGGIFSEAPLTVANSTISGNNGSSVYVDFGGSAQLQNATIAANPGVGLVLHDTATAVNTIIAQNTSGDCSITGSMTSENNNLDSDSTCNFNDPTDQHADPGLGPLANNSGPTPTMALASGSPAVDAGDDSNCPGVDQRGIARPQGPHCDLGAFELEIGAQLSGSFNESIVKPVDLTAAGDSDWALWSYNSSAVPAALTPTETKAGGGRKISDLTIVNGDGTPTRGFGGFADDLVPFNFNWTDGSPDAAVSGGHGGLTAPALGQGLSFTVPAGPAPQELTIWTSAHYANGTLTAHLSDASTPDYTQTIEAEPGEFTNVSENVPAVFTLRYAAASPGQTLTVTWTDDTNNGCPGCDDIVLYGAALDSGLSNLTVNASPSNAGAGIDQVPVSTIPNAWLSFFAGSTSSTPVGSTPVGSTPVGSTPVGSTPVGSTPVGSTPVGSTPVGSTPVGSTPVGSTGLFDLPVGSTPVGSTALSSVLLSQVQLHNVTWDQILCGSLLNKPLTAMTLEDLKENTETCSDGKTSLQHFEALTMKQVDLTTTLLRTVHWATLLMGNTPLSALPGGFNAWCGTNGQIQQDGGSCTNATGATTVLQMDVAGQLGSAPVGSTPVGSTPVGSTPVGSTPVGSTDVPASLLANISLSDIANLDGDLASVVNCTGSFNCAGKTLGDAYRANAILPTATFSNIQNAMAANGITINDLVVAIIGAAGFPWEQLQIQGLQPYSATKSTVHYTISTNVECSLVTEFTITAHLPAGFFPVDGSAQVAFGNNAPTSAGTPVVLGQGAAAAQKLNSYQWTVDCPNGDTSTETATLTFDSWVDLNLGTFKTGATAATASSSISTTGAPVTVHQNPEASDPSTATQIQPDTLVAGHIAFSGEQAFYKVKLDGLPRGSRISALLKVPGDADLDLTMSAPPASSFFSTPVGSTQVGSTPIEDSAVGFSSSGLALPPDTLEDVPVGSTPVGSTPVGSTPVGSTSANRGSGVNEAGAIITAGQNGYATIGVSGYNGATSNQPFVLRVQETPPPALPNCPARTFPNATPAPGALPSSLPTSTKTLFIVDKQRLTAMYGSTAVTSLLSSLHTLAARSEVSGTVLFVDVTRSGRAEQLISTWDATPCDTTARNNVVKAINDVVASYRNSTTGLPNLHYIVLVGSDGEPRRRWRTPRIRSLLSPERENGGSRPRVHDQRPHAGERPLRLGRSELHPHRRSLRCLHEHPVARPQPAPAADLGLPSRRDAERHRGPGQPLPREQRHQRAADRRRDARPLVGTRHGL